MNEIADEIELMNGARDLITDLVERQIPIYICSGSINVVIRRVMGSLARHVESIKANRMTFDDKGVVKDIIGTKYDFEGKADFIRQVVDDLRIHPYEVLFVGNSLNDEWAHQSGALTLCVNPAMTNPDHPFQWTYSIRNLADMRDIKSYIK